MRCGDPRPAVTSPEPGSTASGHASDECRFVPLTPLRGLWLSFNRPGACMLGGMVGHAVSLERETRRRFRISLASPDGGFPLVEKPNGAVIDMPYGIKRGMFPKIGPKTSFFSVMMDQGGAFLRHQGPEPMERITPLARLWSVRWGVEPRWTGMPASTAHALARMSVPCSRDDLAIDLGLAAGDVVALLVRLLNSRDGETPIAHEWLDTRTNKPCYLLAMAKAPAFCRPWSKDRAPRLDRLSAADAHVLALTVSPLPLSEITKRSSLPSDTLFRTVERLEQAGLLVRPGPKSRAASSAARALFHGDDKTYR